MLAAILRGWSATPRPYPVPIAGKHPATGTYRMLPYVPPSVAALGYNHEYSSYR